ncbi:phage major capsid protein [Micromonospora sp. STR1_7]|uniref:Phage major capsid protein n=1 Tax=Micromonospora parastrephiae TaxID=2806101 RepID=A0ABS1XUE0_9ACTN|nr:phage major capsid protein [Micromonospora parastrephiae]MBM0232887.1 phage major capsid protein [Micromonospora parastrephiae]
MPLKGIPTASELREQPTNQTPAEWWKAADKARNAHLDAAGDIAEKGRLDGRDKFLASEQRDYDEHVDQVTRLDHLMANIVRDHPELNEVDRAGVVPPTNGRTGLRNKATLAKGDSMAAWAQANGHIHPEHLEDGGLTFGEYISARVTGRGSKQVRNAMSEGNLAGGGYLVPTILSTQLIDMARNKARVLQAGATVVPMANATVDLAKWAGDPTATWHTENAAVTASDATLARVRLQAKTLMSLVVVSRELVEDAEPVSVDSALRQAFASQFGLTIDAAGLYGTGVAPQPLGVKATSGVTVTPIATNGQALANWDPLVNAVYTVRSANEEPNAIIYSGRTSKNLALLKDTTNQPLRMPDYLDGIARYETQQIPNNLVVGTSGTTTSDIFAGDWSQLLFGVRTELQVTPLTERYAENGQIGFVCWWRGDFAVARTSAFAVTTGIL